MKQFISDNVWKATHKTLTWYYAVSTNTKPAKYLISQRIVAIFSEEMSLKELWVLYDKLYEEFQRLWQRVRDDKINWEDLPHQSPNLIDLSTTIVKRSLKHCNFCHWNCRVDRTQSEKLGMCKLSSDSKVSAYFPHRGEELVLRGTKGSGTIFFTSCTMRCVFCQNADIAKDTCGVLTTATQLADMMLELRTAGCHNINLVGGDPIPHLHTIFEALRVLPERAKHINKQKEYSYFNEFNTPILWNSNFYMSDTTFKLLRTIVDVWLPDLKFYEQKCARRLSKTSEYFLTVSNHIKHLYDLQESVIIRHLVLPNHLDCCTFPILKWVHQQTSLLPINIMAQYHPDYLCDPKTSMYNNIYQDINRKLTKQEYDSALVYAQNLNLNFEAVSFW